MPTKLTVAQLRSRLAHDMKLDLIRWGLTPSM